MDTEQILQSTREGIAKEFRAAFSAHYALRDDASQWVRDILQEVARTDWDRDLCCTFAETWAERAHEDREDVIAEFSDGCVDVYTWRAVEWLMSDSEHIDSADEFLDNAGIDLTGKYTLSIMEQLAQGGQFVRASSIASKMWDMLDEYAICQQ